MPPNQVLRKQLCTLLLPKLAAFPESLNMVENRVSAWIAQPRLQDHYPSCRYSVTYKLVLRILY